MSMLPEDYKEPSTSNYMKFTEGENTFRVLSAPILGYEYWKTEGDKRMPIRKRMDEKINTEELEVNPKSGELEVPKHFWAMAVYNWNEDRIQILEVTQSGIRKAMTALDRSKAWGNWTDYDLIVTKTGNGMETEYSVMPSPKEKLPEEIAQLYKAMNINLEALFAGDDPFSAKAEEIDIKDIEFAKV